MEEFTRHNWVKLTYILIFIKESNFTIPLQNCLPSFEIVATMWNLLYNIYFNYPKYLVRQAWANSVEHDDW